MLVVDDHALIRVVPVLQAGHLQAERDVADLVDADAHHVFLRADVPSVGGFVVVEVGQRHPVAFAFGFAVGLQPSLDPIFQLLTGE